MQFENSKFSYYFSSVQQNIVIGVIVIILYLLVGNGVFIQDGSSNGGNQNNGVSSGSTSVVEFDITLVISLLISLVIGSVMIYVIFTKFSSIAIRILYSIVLGLPYLIFTFEIITLMFFDNLTTVKYLIYSILGFVVPAYAAYFTYIYGKGVFNIFIRNSGILLSAIILGRIIGLYLDLIGVIVFAIILSLFDIYSVFKGPLSKIMGKPQRRKSVPYNRMDKHLMMSQYKEICKKGTPVVMSDDSTLLGIGDVLFFALLLYKSLMIWSWIGFFVTIVTVTIGSLGTMYLLRKISPLPALPLPVFSSLFGYGILYLVYGV